MPEPKKRKFEAETRATMQVRLAARPPAAQPHPPADSPHGTETEPGGAQQRQEVLYRLIDFFKAQ